MANTIVLQGRKVVGGSAAGEARMIHGCSAGEVTREQARLMLIEGGHAETP